jgi:hypothetical protein
LRRGGTPGRHGRPKQHRERQRMRATQTLRRPPRASGPGA